MTVLTAVREVQLPLLAAMLLGGCAAKISHVLHTGTARTEFGPAALFPLRFRQPVELSLSVIELALGLGLIATAGRLGTGTPATCVRLVTGLLFLVATSVLIELRTLRPEAGCGCFGDFSTTPVNGRTLARAALFAAAAFSTLGLPPVHAPHGGLRILELSLTAALELVLIGALSPELGEGLIRLGYSEPCELRELPATRTLAALRRSKAWRRYAGLITSDVPSDIWRELCWRYVVYPVSHEGKAASLVFAVFLQQRRPVIYAALADAVTGGQLPWPQLPPAQKGWRQTRPARRGSLRVASGPVVGSSSAAQADLPLSTDL